ncbi:MAG: O-antigen ligase family protein [Patescibacteria group bacterium]|nr:O-antigen ligase family protein [Patescibacteria group bacterium]
MSQTLFGKTFQLTALLIILAELFSLLSYLIPALGPLLFIVIIITTATAAFKKLEYGLLIVLGELVIGGKGYLFSTEIFGHLVSIRIALFSITLLAWLILIIVKLWSTKNFNNVRSLLATNRLISTAYLLLFIAMAVGIFNGSRHFSPSLVYYDANAWLFLTLLGVFFYLDYNEKLISNMLAVITAGTVTLALKTVILLILFAHNFTSLGGTIYRWIRATGVGEITYVSGSVFRIFFQSQIYILIGLFIVLGLVFFAKKNAQTKNTILLSFGYVYLMSFSLIISQSRSFWLGAMAAFLLLIILAKVIIKLSLKKIIVILLTTIIVIISQIFLLQIISGNFSANPLTQRFSNLPAEPAGLTRLNELKPLANAITQQPIFGFGFGKELTYQSDDPRIRQTNPDGKFTTYAFEWGYLDIWLKIGFLGLAAYLFLIVAIISKALKPDHENKIIAIGFISALVALTVTNIFSPYLNHPLGISFVLLSSAIFTNQKNRLS